MPEQFPGQHESSLAEQLDTYAAMTQSHAAPSGVNSWRAWAPYAAALGSGLALQTAAHADYIHSSIPNLSVQVNTASSIARSSKGIPMNLLGPANFGLSLAFVRSAPGSTFGVLRLEAITTNAAVITNGSGAIRRLSSGAKISASAMFGRGNQIRAVSVFGGASYVRGTWPSGKSGSGFAGVRFNTQNGQTHYGWIRLDWQDPPGGFPSQATVIDWAYNDNANAPIFAGQFRSTVATPAPSSMALALMAAGSAGVLAWRRRRQEVAAAGNA